MTKKMKIKCAIPSRIKECGECEHYMFPYITTSSEGETIDSPPKCMVGQDLLTQKAPCPKYEKQMPHIYENRRKDETY